MLRGSGSSKDKLLTKPENASMENEPNFAEPEIAPCNPNKDEFFNDSGYSRHLSGNRGLLSSFQEKKGCSMTFGDNRKGKVKGYGIIVKGDIDINKVAYVDRLKHNLLSVSQLCDNGLDVNVNRRYRAMLKEDTYTHSSCMPTEEDIYTS
ncbi:hypothetical protein OSB04_006788 [Centaurea solstitialis]|uniref:Retrovirus-related Pol polyprotein from transposon TNT 1-94-like beta-barrel domain-containing protein n=1 Tax=Centaurea solstitialis TaxID=347529 RepID=A0AA38TIK9_9ASTR|nr:hypothetical protein OSB04_006788 [Centaurea solstitialis]